MADIASLQVQLELQSAQFNEEMKKVNSGLDKLNNKVDSVSNSFKKMGAAILSAGAFTVMIGAFKAATNAMDEMDKSSQKLGISVEKLSTLAYAAQQSGVSFDQLSTGLKKLNQNLADVDKGTSDASKALRALGVKGGDSPEVALNKIADAFKGAQNEAQKTAVAMAIFGKSGADLIPLLNEGADGIQTLEERAERLGLKMDGAVTDQAVAFNDSLEDMGLVVKGATQQITAGMLPALSKIVVSMADTLKTGDGWKQFGRGLGEVFKHITVLGIGAAEMFQLVGTALGGLAAAVVLFAQRDFKGAAQTMRDMDKELKRIATDADASVAKILSDSVADVGKAAEETKPKTDALANAYKGLATETNKAAKGIKYVQEALLPAQKILIDLYKVGENKKTAFAELAELEKLSPEALDALGLSIKDIADQTERLKKAADNWTVLDEALKKVAGNEQAIKDLSIAYDDLIAKFMKGGMSDEEFNNIVVQLQKMQPAIEGADTAALDFQSSINKLGEDINGAIASNANNAMNNLIDSFGEAEFSFSSLITSMLKDIAKLVTQLLIVTPMMNALKGSSFFGGFSATPTALATDFPQTFNSPSPSLQSYSQRGFGGGVPVAAMPTTSAPQASKSSDIEFNVYNNTNAEVSTKESTGPDGKQMIDLYIDRRMNERFSNGGMDKVMRSNYGLIRNAGG